MILKENTVRKILLVLALFASISTFASEGRYCSYELPNEFPLPENFNEFNKLKDNLKTVYCRDYAQITGPYYESEYDTVGIGRLIEFSSYGLTDREAAYQFMEAVMINGRKGNHIIVIFSKDENEHIHSTVPFPEDEVIILNLETSEIDSPREFTHKTLGI